MMTTNELALVIAVLIGYPLGRIVLEYLDRWHYNRLMSGFKDSKER